VTMAKSSILGAEAAKLYGPKVEVRQASAAPRAAQRIEWRRLVLAATGTRLEVLWCGLMATLEDARAELENYPLWN